MKILAISSESQGVNWDNENQSLKSEAAEVYKMYLSGTLREIYFTQNSNAVLILECKNISGAKRIVAKLPLVKKGLIRFEFMELHPYPGLKRIIGR
jgi:hypothetical protein